MSGIAPKFSDNVCLSNDIITVVTLLVMEVILQVMVPTRRPMEHIQDEVRVTDLTHQVMVLITEVTDRIREAMDHIRHLTEAIVVHHTTRIRLAIRGMLHLMGHIHHKRNGDKTKIRLSFFGWKILL